MVAASINGLILSPIYATKKLLWKSVINRCCCVDISKAISTRFFFLRKETKVQIVKLMDTISNCVTLTETDVEFERKQVVDKDLGNM